MNDSLLIDVGIFKSGMKLDEELLAQQAAFSITPTGGAMLAAVEDDLEVEAVP